MTTDSLILLVNAARDGDEDAAAEIFNLAYPALCQMIRRRSTSVLQQRIDPEDVAQSAVRSFFVGLRNGRFELEHSAAVRALFTTIGLRKLTRARERHYAAKRDVRTDQCPLPLEAVEERSAINPEDQLLLLEELHCLLTSLSDRDRKIIELRLQGSGITQIAACIKCSEKTVQRVLNSVNEIDSQNLPSHTIGAAVIGRVLQELIVSDHSENQWAQQSLQVSRYRLQKLIGFGSTSKVYQAFDRELEKSVAVKFLRKPLQSDPFVVSLFLKELRLIAEVSSPAILNIHGMGRTQHGFVFLVSDLFETDLERLSKPVPWQSAVAWCRQAAEALLVCHERGLIHCDLKPANVLLNANGQVALCDFGMAKNIFADDLLDVGLRGSLPWMAPEQLDSAEGRLTPATDVYGLGATLFHLLTGCPPYGLGPASALISKIVNAQLPPDLPDLLSEVPHAVRQLCRGMLEPRAANRDVTMADVVTELAKID